MSILTPFFGHKSDGSECTVYALLNHLEVVSERNKPTIKLISDENKNLIAEVRLNHREQDKKSEILNRARLSPNHCNSATKSWYVDFSKNTNYSLVIRDGEGRKHITN